MARVSKEFLALLLKNGALRKEHLLKNFRIYDYGQETASVEIIPVAGATVLTAKDLDKFKTEATEGFIATAILRFMVGNNLIDSDAIAARMNVGDEFTARHGGKIVRFSEMSKSAGIDVFTRDKKPGNKPASSEGNS